MKIIKLAVISIVVLFLVITVIASFIPSTIRVSRAHDFHFNRKVVAEKLSDIKDWNSWNDMLSERIKVEKKSVSDSLVATLWVPETGKNFESGFVLIPHDSSTIVQWYFDFKLRWYPWEKFQGIIYDQQIGPAMERSLLKLDSTLSLH